MILGTILSGIYDRISILVAPIWELRHTASAVWSRLVPPPLELCGWFRVLGILAVASA